MDMAAKKVGKRMGGREGGREGGKDHTRVDQGSDCRWRGRGGGRGKVDLAREEDGEVEE